MLALSLTLATTRSMDAVLLLRAIISEFISHVSNSIVNLLNASIGVCELVQHKLNARTISRAE